MLSFVKFHADASLEKRLEFTIPVKKSAGECWGASGLLKMVVVTRAGFFIVFIRTGVSAMPNLLVLGCLSQRLRDA